MVHALKLMRILNSGGVARRFDHADHAVVARRRRADGTQLLVSQIAAAAAIVDTGVRLGDRGGKRLCFCF